MLSLPNDEGFVVRNANHAAIETCSSETESGLRGSASVPAGISFPVARDLRARVLPQPVLGEAGLPGSRPAIGPARSFKPGYRDWKGTVGAALRRDLTIRRGGHF
jgi:hypothetical protein